MRIEITYGDHRRVFGSPGGVDLVGVTVIHDGKQFSTINVCSGDSTFRRDEEVVAEENLKIILHYYRSPKVAEVVEAFAGFEGMKCTEIQDRDVYLVVWI